MPELFIPSDYTADLIDNQSDKHNELYDSLGSDYDDEENFYYPEYDDETRSY